MYLVVAVILLFLFFFSGSKVVYRKDAPTTRLYSESTREGRVSAATSPALDARAQGTLRGHDQGYDRFHAI
jgi:hypothetical protein